jgi:GNAT superfamily N-acetyltransferase
MYAMYREEREGVETLEYKHGFIQFTIFEDVCYINSIYVKKENRKQGLAHIMADVVKDIALKNNCKQMTAQVDTETNGVEAAMMTILTYGFKVWEIQDSAVKFYKEL